MHKFVNKAQKIDSTLKIGARWHTPTLNMSNNIAGCAFESQRASYKV